MMADVMDSPLSAAAPWRRSPQKPDWSADDRQFPLAKLIAVMAPSVATREPASDCRGAMTGCRGLGRSCWSTRMRSIIRTAPVLVALASAGVPGFAEDANGPV